MCRAVGDDGTASASTGLDLRPDSDPVYAGVDDAEARMVGDVNLFLTPYDGEDDEDGGSGDENRNGGGEERGGRNADPDAESELCDLQGEIDIMIASREDRKQGLGEAAVRAFLRYLARNREAIVSEYVRGVAPVVGDVAGAMEMKTKTATTDTEKEKENEKGKGKENGARLKRLVAKINADNAGSIRLFGNLGFRRRGEPNYFNEISMVLVDFPSMLPSTTTTTTMVPGTSLGISGSKTESGTTGPEVDELGYREWFFDRSRLKK